LILVKADKLRLALVQLASSPGWDENVGKVVEQLAALRQQCDLAVFSENVFCLGDGATVTAAALPFSDLVTQLGALVRNAGVASVFGGVPVRHEGAVRNSSLVFGCDGKLLARYDKIHLFQLDPGSPQGIDETRIYEHGDLPVNFELAGWRIGLTICYDLRFPELFRHYAPCDLVLCTAAFTQATGEVHWQVLLQARAIENLCYVAGVGQGGVNQETQVSLYGHSLAVDPWGKLIGCAEEGEQTLIVELNKANITTARGRLPALDHRRLRC